MFPLAHGESVTRERGHLVLDPYSGESTKRDWTDPDLLELEGVAIAPSSSVETSTDNRRQVATQMSIYCGPGQDILPEDRIRVGPALWDVLGEVDTWTSPFTGWEAAAEFRIKRVLG